MEPEKRPNKTAPNEPQEPTQAKAPKAKRRPPRPTDITEPATAQLGPIAHPRGWKSQSAPLSITTMPLAQLGGHSIFLNFAAILAMMMAAGFIFAMASSMVGMTLGLVAASFSDWILRFFCLQFSA